MTYQHIVENRKGNNFITLTVDEYEVVKMLPEFIAPVEEGSLGQIARMKIILK